MQADDREADALTLSPGSLQPGLLQRYREILNAGGSQLAWSDGSTQAPFPGGELTRLSPQDLNATRKALLLFGTEEAISEHFPFLKTLFIRRGGLRRQDSVTELPLNFIAAFQAFRDLILTTFPGPADKNASKAADDQASLLRTRLLAWFSDMLACRDVVQMRPARFILDRYYLSFEYPRAIEFRESGYFNEIFAVIRAFEPTMQDEKDAFREAEERRCFGMAPLRVEGRFFKIMAPIPDFSSRREKSSGHRTEDHASFVNLDKDLEVSGTMQAVVTSGALDAEPPIPDRGSVNPFLELVAARRRIPASPPPGTPPSAPVARTHPAVSSETPHRAPNPHPQNSPSPPQPSDRTSRILEFCRTPRHREEIQKLVGMNNRDHFRKEVLNRLIAEGRLRPTLPDKPNSPKQKYVAT